MIVLTQGAFSIDLSRNISSHCFEVVPSFSYNDLLNGNIAQKFDLGTISDKFYTDIELCLSFAEFQAFIQFYRDTANGVPLDLSTDLDLFFPNKYNNTKCVITEIKDLGYLGGDILTKNRLVSVRLYLSENQIYASSSIIPNCFIHGIWQQDYNFSDVFNVSEYGNMGVMTNFKNDSNAWNVTFNYLKRSDANDLLSWLLTVRASIVSINSNGSNGNLPNIQATKNGSYNIRSFEFINENTYYTGSLELVERVNR